MRRVLNISVLVDLPIARWRMWMPPPIGQMQMADVDDVTGSQRQPDKLHRVNVRTFPDHVKHFKHF